MTSFIEAPQVGLANLDFQQNINTTSPDFFFINTNYLDAYIQLLEGIRQRRGLLILTGEAGVGKTSLLRKLVNESPATIKCVYCYTTNLDFDNLLAVIGDQLEVMTQEGEFPNRLEALNHSLDNYAKRGIEIAFLIDDAHRLNENALNGLLSLSLLEFEGRRAVQLVLSGIPVLEQILAKIGIFDTSLASAVHVRLEPLTTEEAAAFISRHMQNADSAAVDSLFPLPVIAQINYYTGGIPRLIKMLCERALLLSRIKGQTTISIATVEEAAGELILEDKKIAASPVADLLSLETTQRGNAMQVARMEHLLARSENLPNEETQTLVVGPLAMEQPKEYPPSVAHWGDAESGKKRSSPRSSTGLQTALWVLLALLGGLVGGMGSIYWHQRTTTGIKPSIPAPAPTDTTTGEPAPTDKLELSARVSLVPAPSPTSSEPLAKPEAKSSAKPPESSAAAARGAETAPPAAPSELPSAAPSSTTAKPAGGPPASSYLINGNLWLKRGDIASARLFYQEAAAAGSVPAMVAIGKTYDPIILNQLGIRGLRPDPVKAAEWYLKANKAGDSESTERLQELSRWLSNSPALQESEANALRQLLR